MSLQRLLRVRAPTRQFLRSSIGPPRLRWSSGVSYPLQLASVTPQHAALYKESLENPARFWGDLARSKLHWMEDFTQTMDCDMSGDRLKWFLGGKINVSGEASVASCHGIIPTQYCVCSLVKEYCAQCNCVGMGFWVK